MTHYHLLPFLFLLLRCDAPAGHLAARAYPGDRPTARELAQALRDHGVLLVVYPAGDRERAEAYRQLAAGLGGGRLRVELRPDTAVTAAELRKNPLLLLGPPATNGTLAELLPELPFQMTKDELTIDGLTFRDTATVLTLGYFPNPANPRLPVLVCTGLRDAAVLDYLRQNATGSRWGVGWANWGYTVSRGGQRLLLGQFDDASWRPDARERFDFSAPGEIVRQTRHYRLIAHQGAPAPPQLAEELERVRARIDSFTGRSEPLPLVDYHLYPDTETKGLMLGQTERCHVDTARGDIHAVHSELFRGLLTGAEIALLLRRRLGAPAVPALERGLGIYFTEDWQGRGYDDWARRLAASGNLLPLRELLDEEAAAAGSPLLHGCLSASFVEFLIGHWGREWFLELYGAWRPTPEELEGLERQWHAFLDRSVPLPDPSRPPLPFLRGFNFTHEGYQIYNGYGSRRSAAALDRLCALSANAVAVVPYSWMEDARRPSPIPVVKGAGSEHDEGIIHAIGEARQRGLTVMLKPQLWLGRGSWPGDVEMGSEQDWQAFFTYYHRWLLHYALLAEIHGAEILCIGTELGRTTRQRPDDWRRLIAQVRGVYGGRLTYAANWGEEFEQVTFWEALDYVGLDCYYPLSSDSSATPGALRAGFHAVGGRVMPLVERTGKPLLLTEIGFSSVEAPWLTPHSDGYERPYNEEHQRLCYEIVLAALDAHRDTLGGIFWWKWPTDLDHRGREEGKGFAPNGKAAEGVVGEWFGRWR